MQKGIFITFEGPEGSGKSTQSKIVYEFFKEKGMDLLWTREPGGSEICSQIRRVLLEPGNSDMDDYTEVLLLAADRNEHVANVIKPALAQGKTVICDRFADSTLAYQGYGRGIDMEHLKYLHHMVTRGLSPDLTVLVDIDVEKGLKRVQTRGEVAGGDRIERQKIDFHHRLRKGYLEMAGNYPERYEIVDGFRTLKEVNADINKRIADRFEIFRKYL
jgi:dTMP kinase